MTRAKRILTTVCAASFLLGWTGTSSMQLSSPFPFAGALVLLAKNNAEASYDKGYELGRKDARNNRSSDYRGNNGNSKKWDSDFRRGYEDGYDNRSGNNSSYGRSRNDGTYNRSENNGNYGRSRNDGTYNRSGNGSSYQGPGKMTWRGRVDHYVELNIQGNRVRSREREGSQTLDEQASFSSPLPQANVAVSVRKRDGRGQVSVVQQPNQSNNYTAIVKIDDEKGGADNYEIEMEWR